MKKYLVLSMSIILIVFSLPLGASADTIPDRRLRERVVDEANLLSASEERRLLDKVNEISERQNCDVVIVTVYDIGNKTPNEYADDFFDYNGYGKGKNADGIILLLSMKDRDWAISTTGFAIKAFTDAGQEYIMDDVQPKLSSGNYYDAFSTFAKLCDEYITQAKSGKAYDVNNIPKGQVNSKETITLFERMIIFGVAAVVALIIVSIMKSSLKTVKSQKSAVNYIVEGSMKLTENRDTFLYKNVTKRAKPKNNSHRGGSSTHRSSSGRSHGGSRGKF